MNVDTGCDQCYAIHIYLDCLASKFFNKVVRIRVRRDPTTGLKSEIPGPACETHGTHNVSSKYDF